MILVDESAPITGATASGELLGTLNPGFDISSFSMNWNAFEFSGVVPNVGPFVLAFDPFELGFPGDPLNNLNGRGQPGNPRSLLSPLSTGAPSGSLTVAGNTVNFTFGPLECGSPGSANCFFSAPPQSV